MSTVAPPPHQSPSPYGLRLFGGVLLEGPSGPVEGRTAQRRQLAVLAVLGATGGNGVTREKLIGLLWTENTESKARHHLSDALYAIRHDLGEDAILDAGGGLSLNPVRVGCDAAAFDSARAAGDLETAAGLYAGPFLDGFYVDGAEAFEEWVDATRQRYATAYADVLDGLARAAESRTDNCAAAGWWQRFAAHDPYNSRVCLALMRTLANAGDPANALKHLAEHARILRDQLGIDPDPEVLDFGERLRSTFAPTAESSAPSAWVSSGELPEIEPQHTPHTQHVADGTALGRKTAFTRYAALAVIAMAVGIAAFFALRHGPRQPRLDPLTSVVVPFTLVGTDSAGAVLAERMPDLTAGALTTSRDFHAADLATVRRRWRGAGGTLRDGAPIEATRRIARALGAGTLITGSVLTVSPTSRIVGELHDVQSGRLAARQAIEFNPGAEAAAAEHLLVRLLAEAAGEPRHRVPLLDRHPRDAVLTYVAARMEDGRQRAIARAREALRQDSTLAWAALEWYQRIDREDAWLEARKAATVLWDLRDQMGPEDRAYAEAVIGSRFLPVDDGRAAIARWERAVEAAPTWEAPRTALGQTVWLLGPLTDMPDWQSRAARALDRAIVLSDSADDGAIEGAWWIALSAHDTVRFRRLLAALEPHLGRDREYFRWATAVASGDASGAAHARRPYAWGNRHVFRSVALPRMAGAGAAAVDAYLAELPNGASDPERETSGGQAYVDGYVAYYERDRGHHTEFVTRRPFPTLERWQQYFGEIDARPYWAMLLLRDALYLDAPADSLVYRGLALFSRIADGDTTPAPEAGAAGIAHCWRSQWRLAHGDTNGVETAIRYLRDLEERARAGNVPELDGGGRFAVCPALLAAQRDRVLGRDAKPAVRELDAILRQAPLPPEGYWFVTGLGTPTHDFTRILDNLLDGRMLAAIGDTAAALAAVRRRPHPPLFVNLIDGYLVEFLREEARFAATMGDTAGALRAGRHYLALRPDPPDFPAWRAQWDSVHAELAALRRH
jgi:DNA-binding SARP family transcriptional activator